MDATSSAGIIKRPKASDFFGVPVDDQIADVQVDDAENSIISKRRHSYPSDDDHNGGKANSDAGVREGRIKTGKLRSTTQDNCRSVVQFVARRALLKLYFSIAISKNRIHVDKCGETPMMNRNHLSGDDE